MISYSTILFGINLFQVVSGRLRVFHGTADGEEKTVIEVGRGECLGEMALLAGDDVHSQNCITMRDSEIVMVPIFSIAFHLIITDLSCLLLCVCVYLLDASEFSEAGYAESLSVSSSFRLYNGDSSAPDLQERRCRQVVRGCI